MIPCYKNPDLLQWPGLLERPQLNVAELQATIRNVFEAVQQDGDSALSAFTQQFDDVELTDFQVSKSEMAAAQNLVRPSLKSAMGIAAENIRRFHARQQTEREEIETMPGVTCWREQRAIESVGLYIPGGTAPLFSTVLMLGIPAQLAGCKQVVLCTPPNEEGKVHPAILVAAELAGISSIFKVGGAQAIAAMTLGTTTIPTVSKLFGPGNQYVTAAKQYAQSLGTAIDMPAGPSEVLVFADGSARPDFVAADLLSQAEHGKDSQVVLVSTSEDLLDAVNVEVARQLAELPRKALAEPALQFARSIYFSDQATAWKFVNAYAAEHLILALENASDEVDKVENAGSVFLGHFTPESAGDYASGTNHTLPTNGFAIAYSGVSLDSFVKKITFQHITQIGINNLGPTVIEMAEAEALRAHANAVRVRLNPTNG